MRTAYHWKAGSQAALLTAMLVAAGPVAAEPERYEIDPGHAVVAFLVDHIGFASVLGSFTDVEGSFVFDESTGAVSDIVVEVQTDSVATHHEERDEHLRSDEFLDVREYPAMTFTADGARRIGEREFEIEGELSLLGISQALTLSATLNRSGDYPIGRNAYAVGISARGTLLRSDFGMDYGIANGWVGDEVELIIEIEAQRQ